MVVSLPRSRFRRQLAWALLVLSVVFMLLLFRDFYTGKIDLTLGFSQILNQYTLEIVIAFLCLLAPYAAVLLFWPGQLSVDTEKKTLSYIFSSLWIMAKEYPLDEFRYIEVRSAAKKEVNEYYLLLKGSEQNLSFTFPDVKEATQAAKDLSEAGGLRNNGYVGVLR